MFCTCLGRRTFHDRGHSFWVHEGCGNPTAKYMEGSGGMALLNIFRGGELDGHRYETQDLLTNFTLPVGQVSEYVWTPEKVVVDDRTARVWVHRTLEPVVTQGAVKPSAQRKDRTMSETVTTEAVTTETAVKDTPLLARRKALGLSRKQVAAAIGSTEAKVYRIENGGTRTTEEETTSYAAGLDHLEATVVAEKHAAAQAKAAKASEETSSPSE